MKLAKIPFNMINWEEVEPTEHPGITGKAYWKTQHFGDVRIRHVEYSPNYLADHWCNKGHIILCLSGEVTTELEDGRKYILKPGMSHQIGDDMEKHRTFTEKGVKLFIID